MKDKNWLKEELLRDLMRFNGNPNMADYELGIASGITTAINLTEKLDEPETLSQEWIDENKVARINDLRKMTTSDLVPVEKLKNLLVPKQDDGYGAEKEKLYTVDLPHSYELIKLLHTQTYHIKKYSESGFGDYTNTFTEAEIKDYDERYWAFANEVLQ